jgi:hypothetical protein
MRSTQTRYSRDIPGVPGNHGLTVCFDKTRGFVGISQWDPKNKTNGTDRVLLSPEQVRALLKFLGRRAVKPTC